MSDPLDDLLEGLEGLEDPEFLAEAAGVAREVTESLALDLRASIPYVPSGPVVIRAAVAAVAPPVVKVKVTAAERAAIAAEKARLKAAATAEKARVKAEKEATKTAATAAALLAALKEIKALKAFIRAAGLKVPT